MIFPNAHSGVKKIYIAEIFLLISAVVLGAVAVIATLEAEAIIKIDVIPGAVLAFAGIGGLVLSFVAYILILVGLGQAGRDEPKFFKPAFILSIVQIVLTLAGCVVEPINANIYEWIDLVIRILTVLVSVFIICGIMELAKKLNRSRIVALGRTILLLWCILYAAAIIIRWIPTERIQGIIGIISLVLMIAAYFIYLSYLARASRMLRR